MSPETNAQGEKYIAHIRGDGTKQGVFEHCEGTASLSRRTGEEYGLPDTSRLAGLLHDFGKNTGAFLNYITASHAGKKVRRGSVTHSVQGAVYLASAAGRASPGDVMAQELIRCAVLSHHGLRDCVNPDGKVIFDEARDNLDEGYDALLEYVGGRYPADKVKELLSASGREAASAIKAAEEFEARYPKEEYCSSKFIFGMFGRLLTSILIDADRTDTACFESASPHPLPYAGREDRKVMWDKVLRHYSGKLAEKTAGAKASVSPLNVYRGEISEICGAYDLGEGGVHRLVIPCGSGKTLSSLRMALENARRYGKKRIIYVAPYNSILEQNASELRDYVGEGCGVLEHHSGVVFDSGADGEEGEEYKRYRLLTENWRDSPVIATTAVQFLDTLFSGKTSCVRRMQALGDSVIILDEIQALPVKVLKLFSSAMNFLSYFCSASVVLCSATQPPLDILNNFRMIKPQYIVKDTDRYFHAFKRTKIIDATTSPGYTYAGAADYIAEKLVGVRSLLAIVNTKRSAREIYGLLKSMMPEDGGEYKVYHLSTLMCAAHRQEVLDEIRGLLKSESFSGKIVCVSTQLIEAGVDVSFGRVVRSLAGLDSIIQAAGRCNRHREVEEGEVHIVNISDEDVSKLTDIKKAQDAARQVLLEFGLNEENLGGNLLSDKAMNRYYALYFKSRLAEMSYILPNNPDSSVLDLLTDNKLGIKELRQKGGSKPVFLRQAFGEAGKAFNVIDDDGSTDVIVRRDDSVEDNLRVLSSKDDIWRKMTALRSLQRYTVGLSRSMMLELGSAVVYDEECGVHVLSVGYYSEEYGVSTSRVEDMETLIR